MKNRLQNKASRTQPSKNRRKPPNSHFGRSLGDWAPVWEGLGASGALLGRSWAPLGRSWALLGASWPPLGRPLDGPGRLLGASWTAWEPLGRIFNDLGSILEGFGEGLGGVWMGSGPQNKCFFILNTSFLLNPKCRTQSSEFSSLCLPIAMMQPGHQCL